MSVNGTEIAIGQRWLTRDGQEVEIVATRPHPSYPWWLDDGTSVTDQGKVWCDSSCSNNDLITLIQDKHGFIPWNGGECPVNIGSVVALKFRDSDIFTWSITEDVDWNHSGMTNDIVAYKVVKQEVKPAKVDAEEEDQPKQDKEIVKMNQKYTVKDVLYALDDLSEHYVELDLEEQIEEYLAVRESADYKLYLELKAKFESYE